MRYEQLTPGDSTARLSKIFTANFSFLAYANIKLMLEYNGDLVNNKNYTFTTVLRAAF